VVAAVTKQASWNARFFRRNKGGPSSMRTTTLRLCLRITTLLPLATSIAAQETPAEPTSTSEPIEQIVITAERRESTVQDTPVSISAFDADAMKRQGISGPADLHLHVPGFFYTEGGGNSPITQIAIRGVGNENVTSGGDPGVAYHFDGVYLSRPTAAAAQLFDAERIEVLRGPQGTLYGRNATGGSINVISKKPTEEWDALADFSYGNYSSIRARVAGGGPITDWLKFRVAAVRESHDGFLKNVAANSFCLDGKCNDIDEQDVWAFRTHVLLQPFEGTELLFTMQYHWDEGAAGQYRNDPNTFLTSPFPFSSDKRKIRQDIDTELDMESKFFRLGLDQDLELGSYPLRLSAFISYNENLWTQVADNDFSEQPWTFTTWTEPSEQWTGEVEIASAGDSRFNWILGFFGLSEKAGITFLFTDSNPAVFPFRFDSLGEFNSHSYAGFAEGSFDLTQLTFRLGLRVTSDRKEKSSLFSFTALGAPPCPCPPGPFAPFVSDPQSDKWLRLTGRFVVEFRPTEEQMIYFSASKGYKGGGSLGSNPLQDNIYDPEDIWAFEIGAKTRWFDDRIQANLAGYYNDYDDLQVFILTGFGAHIENAAKAKVGGIELELVAVPFDGLQLDSAVSWNHAEYSEYTSADPVPAALGGAITSDQSGNRLNRTPEWSVNIGGQYSLALGDSTLTPRFDWHFQSETFFRPYGLARDRSPSWDQWNVRVTWDAPPMDAGRFSVQLYMTNVENNDHIMNLSVGAGSELFPEQGNLHPPRLYGFTVGWSY
jgi:iron complex outermembrane receptor protein